MGNTTKAIDDFIKEEIKLSLTDVANSAKSREWFLSRIENVISRRTNEPVLLSNEKFVYFGSYFKQTKVSVVDEYDVLVVIDSNTGIFSQSGNPVGEGVGQATPNHKYDKKYYKSDESGVSPAKLLNWLKGIAEEVTDAFGGQALERQGQAITAEIMSKNIKIDLVPAGKFIRLSDKTEFYNIPKGDKDNGWIVTSPKQDIELLKKVADGKDNFRNVIRIAKYIKTSYNFLVPSFAIETAIVQYGQENKWNNDLMLDVVKSLIFLAKKFDQGKIEDSYNNSNNLLSGINNLGWYTKRICEICEQLLSCQDIEDQEKVRQKVWDAFKNS